MRRRVRWLVLVAVVLVVAGVVAAGLTIAPDLSAARDRVDARWGDIRDPLAARYEALAAVATALGEAGEADRAVTTELGATLDRWRALYESQSADPRREARTANGLEALARRVRANITGSDLLEANEALQAAMLAFDQTAGVVPQPAVRAYNRAVRGYERERSGTVGRLVADVMGYEARSLLVLEPDASAASG